MKTMTELFFLDGHNTLTPDRPSGVGCHVRGACDKGWQQRRLLHCSPNQRGILACRKRILVPIFDFRLSIFRLSIFRFLILDDSYACCVCCRLLPGLAEIFAGQQRLYQQIMKAQCPLHSSSYPSRWPTKFVVPLLFSLTPAQLGLIVPSHVYRHKGSVTP